MSSRYEHTDRIILFFCCSFIYLFYQQGSFSVLLILIALSISCFLKVFEEKTLYRMVLYIGYFLLCLLFINLTFFVPLIIYDLVNEDQKLVLILPLLPLPPFVTHYGLIVSSFVLLVLIISVSMRFKSTRILNYRVNYYHLIDDTKELTLKLNQTNKDLIEKQDNDIHIATLDERNRIAREIHDHVGHQLSSAILQLGALLAISKDDTTKNHLIELNTTLNTGMNNIRQSVHDLYDTSIDLNSKLGEIIQAFTFCHVDYNNTIHTTLEQKQCYAIIAIVKEALSNIIKHSNASTVSIVLREHPSIYQLIIHDNGATETYNPDHGIGLQNMEQRIENLNGHFQVRQTDGFRIFISIPKEL